MELGLTFPLQRFLKGKAPAYGTEPDRRFCWDLHVIDLRGRKCLLAVHCHSRYTFVRYDVAPVAWADISGLFREGVLESLTAAGFSRGQVKGYLGQAGVLKVTRTHGRREEAFLLLVGRLLERCGGCPRPPEEVRPEVRAVCDYLEAHCDRRITLEQLSALAGLSKYHLLRCFTRQKGITPYRYLETVRVNRARALLEQGATPLDAALRAGFADQSHFNHFFKILNGLTPSQYRAVFAAERGEP